MKLLHIRYRSGAGRIKNILCVEQILQLSVRGILGSYIPVSYTHLGLDGIKQEMEPPKSVDVNLFAMTEEQMDALGIEQLPETLGEALEAFEHSSFVRKVLGDHVYTKYLAAKSAEWKKFRAEVTDWEVEEYLYKF